MSFIYDDKKLIRTLCDIGNSNIIKKAKLPGVGSPTPSGTLMPGAPGYPLILPISGEAETVAKALLINLQRSIDPANAVPKVQSIPLGTPEGNPVQAKVENFRTLGDFLQWAAKNKLTWAGKRFAWDESEEKAAQAERAAVFTSYPTNRADRDPVTRKTNDVKAYALPGPIRDYLSYILKTDAVNNDTLRVMLQGVIRELNSKLTSFTPIPDKITDLGLPYSQTSGVDSRMVVDGFLDNILDPNDPLKGLDRAPNFDASPVKLTLGDLDSYDRLLDWLKRRNTKDKAGKTVPVEGRIDSDPCAVIHMLYQRAKALYNKKDTFRFLKNYDKAIERYVQAIESYGPRFKNPQGQACAVTSPGGLTSALAGPATPAGTSGTGAPGAPAAGATGAAGVPGAGRDKLSLTENIKEFLEKANLPLSEGMIRVNRIKDFMGRIPQVISGDSELNSSATECVNICNLIMEEYLASGSRNSPILINSGTDVILNMLRPAEYRGQETGTKMCPLFRQLDLLVLAVIKTMNRIQEIFANQLKSLPALSADLYAQVGTPGFYRGSTAGSNRIDLDRLLRVCPVIK